MALVTGDGLRDGIAYFQARYTKDYAAAAVLERHGDLAQMLTVMSTFLERALRATHGNDDSAVLEWAAQYLAEAADDAIEDGDCS